MKSIALKPQNNDEDKAMTMNYYVLGKVFKASKEYPKALENYKKAIQVSEKIGVDLNLPEIYSSLIELYQKTGKKDSIIYFENKLKELEIKDLKSKYNSLQKVVNQDLDAEKKQNNWQYALVGLLVIAGTASIFFVRKNKTKHLPNEDYSILFQLLENNDASYLFTFEKNSLTFQKSF